MEIKALINCSIEFQNVIDELNDESKTCQYEFLKQTNLSMSAEMLIIKFEILRDLGVNATYDLLKMALLEIITKICAIRKQKSISKTTSIVVIVNDKRAEVNVSFELNDEQKNQVVDAAIRKLFD